MYFVHRCNGLWTGCTDSLSGKILCWDTSLVVEDGAFQSPNPSYEMAGIIGQMGMQLDYMWSSQINCPLCEFVLRMYEYLHPNMTSHVHIWTK